VLPKQFGNVELVLDAWKSTRLERRQNWILVGGAGYGCSASRDLLSSAMTKINATAASVQPATLPISGRYDG